MQFVAEPNMARRSHSVADAARRFPVMHVSHVIEEQYSDEEDGGESEDVLSSSLSCLEGAPAFHDRRSPLGHQGLSVQMSYDFKRRTRVLKGRPDCLQRLDGTEWREAGSARMRDTCMGQWESSPSLQVVKIDPSPKNVSQTVESAALRAKLGLTRSRVPEESGEQPLQAPVSS